MRRRLLCQPLTGLALGLALACTLICGSWVLAQGVAGIAVDAQGVLVRRTVSDPTGQLAQQRLAIARASLSPDVARFSPLRKVSLTRLEAAIKANNGVPTDEMRYLAGLLRVEYLFAYPETGDIVIAGPAEGWMTAPDGRVVGIRTGKPVIQLQDLVVALRAFPPAGEPTPMVGCSIDPTEEGLARLQRFFNQIPRQSLVPGQEASFIQFIATNAPRELGMHKVTISGIPADTHFAHVMVEADYLMKLIGIGLERPPVQLVTYIDRARGGSTSELTRWFFVPDYKCVKASQDGLAMQIIGEGVKLVGEDELVSVDGTRRTLGRSNRASLAFTNSFTAKYSELAKVCPVYAELRNLIDLLIVAAYIQKNDLYGKVGWQMELFGDENAFKVRTYPAPKLAPPAMNVVFKQGKLMTPIGGGVEIQPLRALNSQNLLPDDKGQVAKTRQEISLPEGRWWWD